MTSTQLINSLPLNVTALKDLSSSYGYSITPVIKKGTKFKIISSENVNSTTGGSGGSSAIKKIITDIPWNGIYLRLTLRLSDNSIVAFDSDSVINQTSGGLTSSGSAYYTPILNAIKIDRVVRNNFENISAVPNNQSSSYLGESIISKKSQQTKNILVIIAMLAILIVAYLAVTGKLFKSLQS